jgi:mono/diheme cytochrome c family protein
VSKCDRRRHPTNFVRSISFIALAIPVIAACFPVTYVRAQAQATKPSSKTDSVPASNGPDGKKIFETHRCAGCHGNDGQGSPDAAAPRIGPPPVSLSDFVKFVRNPVGNMPPFSADSVSDAELAEVYAYLKSFPPAAQDQKTPSAGNGNADNGARLFTRDGCYECHGREGQGARHTSAPRIGPPAIPFPEFAKYVRHPTGSMPPYTDKVTSEAELADIYAFLKSRPTPPPADSIPLLNQ